MPLETEYRSDSHDLVHDFYVPCLERSTRYRRAVGYFTSRGLSVAAQGITALIQGGGRMLLVASPLFDADDLEAIQQGDLARDDLVVRSLLRQIESTPDSIVKDRVGYLAWLIAEDRLEIRIAIPQHERWGRAPGPRRRGRDELAMTQVSSDECPFCNLPRERVFHEGRLFKAVWDIFPVSTGHALLIPNRHVATWFDANPEEQAELCRRHRDRSRHD